MIMLISAQDVAPRQDKHLVRWIFHYNCPPLSGGRDRQTFRQGFKIMLLKVPEGFSNTNSTESQLEVSETWALKSYQRFSYKLPSVLGNLIYWLCLHCTIHLRISNQSCKYL